jgi:hypothetical protein
VNLMNSNKNRDKTSENIFMKVSQEDLKLQTKRIKRKKAKKKSVTLMFSRSKLYSIIQGADVQ